MYQKPEQPAWQKGTKTAYYAIGLGCLIWFGIIFFVLLVVIIAAAANPAG